MTLLGVDIGTTGCKAAAVSAEGVPLATAYREYPLLTPRPGWAELDPDVVWEATRSAVREVTSAAVAPPRAMAVSCLGEAVTPIDGQGRPLGPSIVSFDRRAAACHERLVERVGRDRFERITGLAPMPHYTVAKWNWLATEAPDIYRAAARLVCYGDLVAARLGLEPIIDHTMAARTLAFDQKRGSWDHDILEAAGVDQAKLPTPARSGIVVGTIPPAHSRDLGLAPGALLVTGGLDQACAAHALGVGSAGVGSAGVGSAGVGSAGVGSAGVGSAGVGSAGVGSAGVGSAGVGSAGVGSAGVGSAGVGSAGVGSAGVGSAGVGSAGVGSAGVGSAGVGSAGVGSAGVGGPSVDCAGSALLSLGTVAVLAMVLAEGRPRPIAVPTGPHVVEGRSLAVAGAPAGGAVLRWYRDVLGAADAEQARKHGHADFYDTIVSSAAEVETTSIVVPHFAGSRTAFADPDSLGVMAGLTFATDRRHLVRALLEGVALETAVMAERLAAAVDPVASLRAAGGGSQSGPWMQIFADVLGIPVESAASSYAAAVGAALIAGSAVGVVDGEATMPMTARFEPDEARTEGYRAKLVLYRHLYETMAAVRRAGSQDAPGSAGQPWA